MATFEKKFDSIKDRNKTMDKIWGTKNGMGSIGHPRVKLIFHQEIEKTGRTKPAYITLEGDKEWVDAYKKIAFNGNGKFQDVVKYVDDQKNEGTIKLANLVTAKRETINESNKVGKYDLFIGYLGNGITVADKNREKDNDYYPVAHIDAPYTKGRKISWRDKKAPANVKKVVKKTAQEYWDKYDSKNESILELQQMITESDPNVNFDMFITSALVQKLFGTWLGYQFKNQNVDKKVAMKKTEKILKNISISVKKVL